MASLKVKFEAVTSGLSRAFTQVEARASAMKRKLQQTFSGLGGLITGALSFAGFSFGAGQLKTIVNDLDNLGKAARNLGVSGEELQKFQYAAKSVNFPVEQIQPSFDRMRKMIGDAADGIPSAIASLGRLGLTMEDLKGKSTAEQFDAVSRAILGIKDPTEQAAAAMSIFGKSGAKMLNFMREYQTQGKNLAAMGGLISNEDIQAAEDFNQACTDIGTAIRAWTVKSGFIQQLKDIAEELLAMVTLAERLNKSNVFDTKKGVDHAIEQAAQSGNYSEADLKKMRRWSKQYGNRYDAGILNNDAFLKIDQALREAGLGDLARTKTSGWNQFAGSAVTTTLKTTRKEVDDGRQQRENRQAEAGKREKVRADALGEAERKKAEKVQKMIDAQATDLEKQLRRQQLILQGKEREAAIQQEIDRAEKTAAAAGVELSEESRRRIADAAGKLFDATRPFEASKLHGPENQVFTDSLLRMGGQLGSIGNQGAGANYQKITAEKLTELEGKVSGLSDKIPGRAELLEALGGF